jgi:hypothetical protein
MASTAQSNKSTGKTEFKFDLIAFVLGALGVEGTPKFLLSAAKLEWSLGLTIRQLWTLLVLMVVGLAWASFNTVAYIAIKDLFLTNNPNKSAWDKFAGGFTSFSYHVPFFSNFQTQSASVFAFSRVGDDVRNAADVGNTIYQYNDSIGSYPNAFALDPKAPYKTEDYVFKPELFPPNVAIFGSFAPPTSRDWSPSKTKAEDLGIAFKSKNKEKPGSGSSPDDCLPPTALAATTPPQPGCAVFPPPPPSPTFLAMVSDFGKRAASGVANVSDSAAQVVNGWFGATPEKVASYSQIDSPSKLKDNVLPLPSVYVLICAVF